MAEINGNVVEGFGLVADAFGRNFSDHGEVGAAFCLYVDGANVVDLWGGYIDQDHSAPWQRETLVNVYSTSKGLGALCAHILVDRGQLDLDD